MFTFFLKRFFALFKIMFGKWGHSESMKLGVGDVKRHTDSCTKKIEAIEAISWGY